MNLGGPVDMKSVITKGHREAVPAKNKKCFIEWSEGLSFTVELKRRGILSRTAQTDTGRTPEVRWSNGLGVSAGFFDFECPRARRSAACLRLDGQWYGTSVRQDLLGQDLLDPEWEMTTFRAVKSLAGAKSLAGSIDNWLRTFKVR